MNVTVHVPPSLREAVDGRAALELGVPSTAGVGDVLETLLKLYPKLRRFLVTERAGGQNQLHVFLAEQAVSDADRPRSGLREGQRLYLFASSPRRVSGEVA